MLLHKQASMGLPEPAAAHPFDFGPGFHTSAPHSFRPQVDRFVICRPSTLWSSHVSNSYGARKAYPQLEGSAFTSFRLPKIFPKEDEYRLQSGMGICNPGDGLPPQYSNYGPAVVVASVAPCVELQIGEHQRPFPVSASPAVNLPFIRPSHTSVGLRKAYMPAPPDRAPIDHASFAARFPVPLTADSSKPLLSAIRQLNRGEHASFSLYSGSPFSPPPVDDQYVARCPSPLMLDGDCMEAAIIDDSSLSLNDSPLSQPHSPVSFQSSAPPYFSNDISSDWFSFQYGTFDPSSLFVHASPFCGRRACAASH